MEKVIYDENKGLWYELQGDYYIPCLKLPEEEQQPIGVWGQRHLQYIKAHRKGFYTTLLTKCELNRHLADVNKQAASPCACFYSYFRLCRFKRYLNRIFVVWHL